MSPLLTELSLLLVKRSTRLFGGGQALLITWVHDSPDPSLWCHFVCFDCFQIVHNALGILADATSIEEIEGTGTFRRALRGAGRCVAELCLLTLGGFLNA